MNLEARAWSMEVELRDAEADMPTLSGIAPPYNTLSRDLGGFQERFSPGAFGDLEGRDVIASFEHNGALLLGRTPHSLSLEETKRGLKYAVQLPDTQTGREVAYHVREGNIQGSSFEFMVNKEEWDTKARIPIRTVLEAELYQVGPVTNPAYDKNTKVALRTLKGITEAELEDDPDLSSLIKRELELRLLRIELML